MLTSFSSSPTIPESTGGGPAAFLVPGALPTTWPFWDSLGIWDFLLAVLCLLWSDQEKITVTHAAMTTTRGSIYSKGVVLQRAQPYRAN